MAVRTKSTRRAKRPRRNPTPERPGFLRRHGPALLAGVAGGAAAVGGIFLAVTGGSPIRFSR